MESWAAALWRASIELRGPFTFIVYSQQGGEGFALLVRLVSRSSQLCLNGFCAKWAWMAFKLCSVFFLITTHRKGFGSGRVI